jgi:glycosyltransferase involved in cell wall biosynthesis
MKVLFVVPYPYGVAASQRFRVEQFFPLLTKNNIDYKLEPFWDNTTWQILYKPKHVFQKVWGMLKGFINRILVLLELPKYDFIFVHREATPIGPPWFEWLACKVFQKKLIFDIDDALWLPNTTDSNAIAAKFKQHQKVNLIMKWCYRVSAGNKYLQQYAKQFNLDSVLLPTTVNTLTYYNQLKYQETDKITIGWTGSHSTLPFLDLITPVLQKLESEFQFNFVVIADKQPEIKLKSLLFIPWEKETEIQDLLKFNIGIMPLPLTEWAEGKCAFKAIQYMALGIPAVVSSVGANLDAVPDGVTGFVCNSEEEWYQRLRLLLQQTKIRITMGEAGKRWVEKRYALHSHSNTFLALFS